MVSKPIPDTFDDLIATDEHFLEYAVGVIIGEIEQFVGFGRNDSFIGPGMNRCLLSWLHDLSI